MRLFFAVTLPEEIIAQIGAVQAELRAVIGEDGVRWTRPDQFHYTLKFLGEQSLSRAERAVATAQAVREASAPFALTLGGVGAFPNSQRPSTLWLGVIVGTEALSDLAARLDQALARQHFPRERRPLKAHLTLARIKSYAGEIAVARALKTAHVGEIGPLLVDRFVLMQSVLKSSGAEYAIVAEFTF